MANEHGQIKEMSIRDNQWKEAPVEISLAHVFLPWCNSPSGPRPLHYRWWKITLRHPTLGGTPLGEWSARQRELHLATHNTHKRKTSMPPAGYEHTTPASQQPHTHALGRAATGIGVISFWFLNLPIY
jgi:hypothetical protein